MEQTGKLTYRLLIDKAQRTYDGDRIMDHLQRRGHGGRCRTLVCDVHEPCGEDVILVMSQGHLVESVVSSKGEEGLAAIPSTKEAACLTLVGALIKMAVEDMKADAQVVTERLQKAAVGLIRHIVHDDMGCLYLY